MAIHIITGSRQSIRGGTLASAQSMAHKRTSVRTGPRLDSCETHDTRGISPPIVDLGAAGRPEPRETDRRSLCQLCSLAQRRLLRRTR